MELSARPRTPKKGTLRKPQSALKVEDRGHEPELVNIQQHKTCVAPLVERTTSDALSDAVDIDLAEVVELWPMLSDEQRRAVAAAVRA